MSPAIIKAIGSVVGVCLIAVGHSNIFPIVPTELFTALASLIFGALHIPQPGTQPTAKPAVKVE